MVEPLSTRRLGGGLADDVLLELEASSLRAVAQGRPGEGLKGGLVEDVFPAQVASCFLFLSSRGVKTGAWTQLRVE